MVTVLLSADRADGARGRGTATTASDPRTRRSAMPTGSRRSTRPKPGSTTTSSTSTRTPSTPCTRRPTPRRTATSHSVSTSRSPAARSRGHYRYTADTTKLGVDGTIILTSTGKVADRKRTVQATLRRRSFLDYLYFTDFETQDPASYTGSPFTASQAQTYCAKHYYDGRNSSCSDIQFISADTINGPLHSNDAILMCGSPTFNGNTSTSWTTSGTAGATTARRAIRTSPMRATRPYLPPLSLHRATRRSNRDDAGQRRMPVHRTDPDSPALERPDDGQQSASASRPTTDARRTAPATCRATA